MEGIGMQQDGAGADLPELTEQVDTLRSVLASLLRYLREQERGGPPAQGYGQHAGPRFGAGLLSMGTWGSYGRGSRASSSSGVPSVQSSPRAGGGALRGSSGGGGGDGPADTLALIEDTLQSCHAVKGRLVAAIAECPQPAQLTRLLGLNDSFQQLLTDATAELVSTRNRYRQRHGSISSTGSGTSELLALGGLGSMGAGGASAVHGRGQGQGQVPATGTGGILYGGPEPGYPGVSGVGFSGDEGFPSWAAGVDGDGVAQRDGRRRRWRPTSDSPGRRKRRRHA
jgi:hypothetical protein